MRHLIQYSISLKTNEIHHVLRYIFYWCNILVLLKVYLCTMLLTSGIDNMSLKHITFLDENVSILLLQYVFVSGKMAYLEFLFICLIDILMLFLPFLYLIVFKLYLNLNTVLLISLCLNVYIWFLFLTCYKKFEKIYFYKKIKKKLYLIQVKCRRRAVIFYLLMKA